MEMREIQAARHAVMEEREERDQQEGRILMEESGDDLSNTITLVTPRKDYIYPAPSKFLTPVQETSSSASTELVCYEWLKLSSYN